MTQAAAGPEAGFETWPALCALALAGLYMATAAALYAPSPEAAFLSDDSPVAWLSSAQLWAIAMLALNATAARLLPRLLGLWLVLALSALAFDEQFLFHERWKFGCAAWFDACRHHAWVGELPTLAVGVVGLASAAWLHRALPAGAARRLLWSALAVGVFALVLDVSGHPAVLAPWEEAFEVVSEALFGGAMLGLRAGGRNALQGYPGGA